MLNVSTVSKNSLVWFGFLRIYVDLAVFQPYLYLEVGDNQSLIIQVARPGIEPRSSCSASQELNHSATAAPFLRINSALQKDTLSKVFFLRCTIYMVNIYVKITWNLLSNWMSPCRHPWQRGLLYWGSWEICRIPTLEKI